MNYSRLYYSAVSWLNALKIPVTSVWVTIDSGSCTWNQKFKPQLNPPVCTAVGLYPCVQQIPVLTPAVPGIFSVSFCSSNQISWTGQTISREELICKFFPGSYQQHRGEKIKNMLNRISQTVKLRIIKNTFEPFFYIEKFLPVRR